jgi:hypothetical protein
MYKKNLWMKGGKLIHSGSRHKEVYMENPNRRNNMSETNEVAHDVNEYLDAMSEIITEHVEILREAFGRLDTRGPNRGSQFLIIKSGMDLIWEEIQELEETVWETTTKPNAIDWAVELLTHGPDNLDFGPSDMPESGGA